MSPLHCAHCSKANPDDARFCAYCGKPLQRVCDSCQSLNPPEAPVCVTCGCALTLEDAPSQPTLSLSADQAKRLSRYMPKHLIAKILESRDAVIGERKQATFLFADVVGSTSLGDQFDEEEFRGLMDGALQRMIEQVHRYEGTVGQLRGDEVFALFGLPLVHEDDPERAVRTALGIRTSIREYADQLAEGRGIERFDIRVTLHTGDVIAGEIGSDLHAEYTAMGDAVNTTAKLQAVAKPGTIVTTEETYRLVQHLVHATPLGKASLKGKSEPVDLFEITGIRDGARRSNHIEGLKSQLVGRSQEMARLAHQVEQLREGRGGVTLITGHAGIGKTRIMAEARSTIPEADVLWLEGNCVSFAHSHSYHPFIGALRRWIGLEEGDEPGAAERGLAQAIAGLDPEPADRNEMEAGLKDLLGLQDHDLEHAPQQSPEEVQRRIERSFREVLIHAAALRPLVIHIEDLHWADPASIELTRTAITCCEESPILLICTSRPDRTSPVWQIQEAAQAAIPDRLATIELTPLSFEDSANLVSGLLKLQELPQALREGVLERAEGNPLYVEELLRSLISKGVISRSESGWSVEEGAAHLQVPRLLRGIIADRIDGLGEDAKQLLRAASVIGRRFASTLLDEVLSTPEAHHSSTINRLSEADLLQPLGSPPHAEFAFYHELIREVAYESMLGEARTTFHHRAGIALERLYEGRIEEHAAILAHHYHQGNESRRAAELYLVAARHAADLYSNTEAIELYSAALDLARGLADAEPTDEEHEALVGRATVLARVGRADDEATDIEALRTLCEASSLHPRAAEICLLSSDHACRTGRFDDALQQAETSEKLSAQAGDIPGRGKALRALGVVLSHLGDLEGAQEKLQEALSELEETEERLLEARVRKELGTTRARLGDLDGAVEQYTVALDLFRHLKELGGESEILGNLASLHYLRADFENASVRFAEARRLFQKLGNARNEAKCLNNLGLCQAALGDYEEARKLHEEAYLLHAQIGDEASKANALSNLGIAQEASAVRGDPAFESQPIGEAPLVQQAESNHRSALESYQQSGDRVGTQRSHHNLGCTLITKGDPEGALQHLREALTLAQDLGQLSLARRALAAMGRAHLLRAETVDALAYAHEAASMLGSQGAPESEEVRYSYFRALLAADRHEEAVAELDLAIKAFETKAARIRDAETRATFRSAHRRLTEAKKRLEI